MNIYQSTVKCQANVTTWAELVQTIQRIAQNKPRDWHLPIATCLAVGGSQPQALPAIAILANLQASIILVDDMLDNDPRGQYHTLGHGVTANLALALQATAHQIIAQSQLSANNQLTLHNAISHMMHQTAQGQALDVQTITTEEAYWDMVRLKSAPFYGMAFYIGAVVGNAPAGTANQILQLGQLFGEMIQIHDDLEDTMSIPANPDWTENRAPLPILFAQTVPHPDRDHFIHLRQQLPNPLALARAQQILLECGAISYCLHQLQQRHTQALTLLNSLDIPAPHHITSLINDMSRPIDTLINHQMAQSTPAPALAK